LKGHSAEVRAVAVYRQAGRWRAVSASDDDTWVTLKLWDLERNKPPKTLKQRRPIGGEEEFIVYIGGRADQCVRSPLTCTRRGRAPSLAMRDQATWTCGI
jgi:hypothetical protein